MPDIKTQQKNSKNLHAMDVGKFIFAFFVVAGHTNPLSFCKNQSIIDFYYIFLNYAVPFFFLSTGYLIGCRVDPLNVESNLILIGGNIKKTIRMYIFCSLLYLPLAIVFYIRNGFSLSRMMLDYLKGFVFLGEHYNSWQLWYLLSAIYALLFVRMLLRYRLSSSQIAVVGLCFIPVMCIINRFISYDGYLPKYLNLIQDLLYNTIYSSRLLSGFLVIPLGLFISQIHLSKKISILLFVLGFVLNITSIDFFRVAGNAISAVGIFCFALNIQLPDSSLYKMFRTMSTDIFVMHMWVWTLYYMLVYHEKTFGFDSFAVTSVICVLLSYLKYKYVIHRKVNCKIS